MKYAIIAENDISKWDDHTGVKYHFPSRYLNILRPGTKVIYYKGKQTDKKFSSQRLSKDPHYFATAEIGNVTQEKNTKNYYAEIVNYNRFRKAVPFRINGDLLEDVPANRLSNYWRNGVRPATLSVYERIHKNATLEEKEYNDQQAGDLETVIIEGGKKKVFTTKYERKKESRDQALKIHGYTCQVCCFNFQETYGNWGEGFIHVHHLKPLSTNEEEVEINPVTDLSVVCPNCHSMIHRKKNVLKSLEELRKMIKAHGKKKISKNIV